jgi:hypothetical protein
MIENTQFRGSSLIIYLGIGAVIAYIALFCFRALWPISPLISLLSLLVGSSGWVLLAIVLFPRLFPTPRFIRIADEGGIELIGSYFDRTSVYYLPWSELTAARMIERAGGVDLQVQFVSRRRPRLDGWFRVREADQLLKLEPIKVLLAKSSR